MKGTIKTTGNNAEYRLELNNITVNEVIVCATTLTDNYSVSVTKIEPSTLLFNTFDCFNNTNKTSSIDYVIFYKD